jgi:hypothetical protein
MKIEIIRRKDLNDTVSNEQNMKVHRLSFVRKLLYLLSGLFLIWLLYYFYLAVAFNSNLYNPFYEPPKPANVHGVIRWLGEPEGGIWIGVNYVLPREKVYDVTVYTETGSVWINSKFMLSNGCSDSGLDAEHLLRTIKSFNGKRFVLKNRNECYLEQVQIMK